MRWAGVRLPLARWDRVARYSEVGGAQVLLQLKWVRAGVAKVHCTAASSDESFNILFKYSDFISLQLFWQSMPGLWDKSTTSDHHTPPHHHTIPPSLHHHPNTTMTGLPPLHSIIPAADISDTKLSPLVGRLPACSHTTTIHYKPAYLSSEKLVHCGNIYPLVQFWRGVT